jgi:hypothetical protein
MTKRSTISTLPPFVFAFGQGIYAEDVAEVIEQLAYSGAHNAEHLAGGASGPAGWGASTNEPAVHGVVSTSTKVTIYVFQIWIHPDTISLNLAGRMLVTSTESHDLEFTIGSDVQSLTFTHSSGSIASVSSSGTSTIANIGGTGLQTCTMKLQRTVGSVDSTLASWNIRGNVISDGALPNPPNE